MHACNCDRLELLSIADTDSDGRISRAEFTAYVLRDEPLDEEGSFVNDERRKELAAQLRVAHWVGI